MKIHVLFAQRVCRYPGEYAPEALDVMDGFGHEDNPDFLLLKQEEARKTKEFSAVEIVTIQVDGAAIAHILQPPVRTISGTVIAESAS